jgi:transcription elongation factor GreA
MHTPPPVAPHASNDGAPTTPDRPPGAPVLTPAAARSIAAEVVRLRAGMQREFTTRRREALSVAPGDGDAHWAIGEDELVVRARIGHLEALLHQATIVDQQPGTGEVVSLGARVTVEDVATGRQHTYTLVAWNDGGAQSVSAASPVGQAVLGRSVGEEVTISLPTGRSRQLRIAGVQTPERPLL